ncbi:MAG: hypothetical protein JNK74_29585, partial [Candidatus Hydrogenedentes bacterium]|nr:hypothetical protein [Candidatus Hydrogenedentota bacterium]
MEPQSREPDALAPERPEGLHIDARQEPLVSGLLVITRLCVRALAVLMTLVIIWSVADVGWILYQRL